MSETKTSNCVRQTTYCSACGKRISVSTLLPQGFMATVNYHNVRSGCCNAHVQFLIEVGPEQTAFASETYPAYSPNGAMSAREKSLMDMVEVKAAMLDGSEARNRKLEKQIEQVVKAHSEAEAKCRRAETLLRNYGIKVGKALDVKDEEKPKRSHKKKVAPPAAAPKNGAESLT